MQNKWPKKNLQYSSKKTSVHTLYKPKEHLILDYSPIAVIIPLTCLARLTIKYYSLAVKKWLIQSSVRSDSDVRREHLVHSSKPLSTGVEVTVLCRSHTFFQTNLCLYAFNIVLTAWGKTPYKCDGQIDTDLWPCMIYFKTIYGIRYLFSLKTVNKKRKLVLYTEWGGGWITGQTRKTEV